MKNEPTDTYKYTFKAPPLCGATVSVDFKPLSHESGLTRIQLEMPDILTRGEDGDLLENSANIDAIMNVTHVKSKLANTLFLPENASKLEWDKGIYFTVKPVEGQPHQFVPILIALDSCGKGQLFLDKMLAAGIMTQEQHREASDINAEAKKHSSSQDVAQRKESLALSALFDALADHNLEVTHSLQEGAHRFDADNLTNEQIGIVATEVKKHFGRLFDEPLKPGQLIVHNNITDGLLTQVQLIDIAEHDPAIDYATRAQEEMAPRLARIGRVTSAVGKIIDKGPRNPTEPDGTGFSKGPSD